MCKYNIFPFDILRQINLDKFKSNSSNGFESSINRLK